MDASILTTSAPRGLNSRALQRVLEHVEAHLGEDLTLDRLAAAACLSRFHFSRKFRESTGCTPMGYVTRRRLESAKRLLAARSLALCDVAHRLGFCDQSHFTRAFRKATGLTPGLYARATLATEARQ